MRVNRGWNKLKLTIVKVKYISDIFNIQKLK